MMIRRHSQVENALSRRRTMSPSLKDFLKMKHQYFLLKCVWLCLNTSATLAEMRQALFRTSVVSDRASPHPFTAYAMWTSLLVHEIRLFIISSLLQVLLHLQFCNIQSILHHTSLQGCQPSHIGRSPPSQIKWTKLVFAMDAVCKCGMCSDKAFKFPISDF